MDPIQNLKELADEYSIRDPFHCANPGDELSLFRTVAYRLPSGQRELPAFTN